MARGKFSIEDAFESDEEDPIRLYGATTDVAPLRGKVRPSRSRGSGEADGGEDREDSAASREEMMDATSDMVTLPEERLLRTPSGHSFGSDSLSVSTRTFHDKRWYRHPKVRENWKIVLASFILLLVGIGLLIAGVAIEIAHTTAVQSFVFFIAGAICLIPGAYHVVYIIFAVKGKRGFNFYNLGIFK